MEEKITDEAIRATVGMPLVDLAQINIKCAIDGYTDVAREIIKQAIVGIKTAIRGEPIDAERLIYLAHIADALQMILNDIQPKKALCLSTEGGSPRKHTSDLNFCVFLEVGMAYSRYKKAGGDANKPVGVSIENIARNRRTSKANIKKAWEEFGGLHAWKQIKNELLES